MAANDEPSMRKRKLGGTTVPPRIVMDGFTVVNGKYVKVEEEPTDDAVDWSSDDDVNPALEKYYRQIDESDGFDLDMSMRDTGMLPNCSFLPFTLTNEEDLHSEIGICGRVGLHWHNFQKGLNFQLLELVKYNSSLHGLCTYYITMEAMNPTDSSKFTFQTCLVRVGPRTNEDNRIFTEVCRVKPGSKDEKWDWNDEAIDDFHSGELEWLSEDALTDDKHKQFYEVHDLDIQENDWLHLYAEFAFHSVQERRLTSYLRSTVPLKIKKVVVQTREDVESSKKLKSENAVFYITFSDCDQTENHKAIVRRVTDGIPGHVSLEVKVRLV